MMGALQTIWNDCFYRDHNGHALSFEKFLDKIVYSKTMNASIGRVVLGAYCLSPYEVVE